MQLLYNLSIYLYVALVRIVAIFNKKAKLWFEGRKNLLEQIKQKVIPGYYIWIHAASVGEFEQARPLIEKIKAEYPTKKILVTFFSPSAYELRKNYELANHVFYLPADTISNAKAFLDIVKPEMAIFVKYEFWFNFIQQIHNRHIPLYLISGIFRPNQHFFAWYGAWFRKHLSYFTHFFIQDHTSAKLLRKNGLTNFSITGDTRFDRVKQHLAKAPRFAPMDQFVGKSKLLLCGSTWPADEKMIAEMLAKTDLNLKIMVVPHEIGESHIKQIQKTFQAHNQILWTEINENTTLEKTQLIIVNQMGILMSLYRYASVAYIGGGFGAGIHNILEAACWAKPILFGPNYHKFKEAKDLIALGAAQSIHKASQLQLNLHHLLQSPDFYQQCSVASSNYVENNLGATEKIFEKCFTI